MMTLHERIQRFVATANPGDRLLLSEDGNIEDGTGLILMRKRFGCFLYSHTDAGQYVPFCADRVYELAAAWLERSGQQLAEDCEEPVMPLIRDQLILCCYRHGMPEDETRPMLEDLLGDLAAWLDQRHSGSSQTADLLRAIFP
jgi:hypothetical protein